MTNNLSVPFEDTVDSVLEETPMISAAKKDARRDTNFQFCETAKRKNQARGGIFSRGWPDWARSQKASNSPW